MGANGESGNDLMQALIDSMPQPSEADCTCRLGEGCDEEGDPGCAYCRSIDCEWPCPSEVVPCPDHDEIDGPHHNVECCYWAAVRDV